MHHRTSSQHARAFTLIELLTVIAIIAILMALLFPAIGGAKENARRAKAATDIQGGVTAIKQYYTEYGKYPDVAAASSASASTSTTDEDTKVGDEKASISNSPNAMLFCTLRAIAESANANNAQNPRKISFFEGRRASNPDAPKDGFLDDAKGDATKKGALFDPWGMQYNFVWDSTGDNQIDVSAQYTDFAAPNLPRVTVGGFSLGKDLMLGDKGNKQYKKGTDKSDDVVSWQ